MVKKLKSIKAKFEILAIDDGSKTKPLKNLIKLNRIIKMLKFIIIREIWENHTQLERAYKNQNIIM